MTLQMREQEIREESLKKGREEGIEIGMEKGMEKGIQAMVFTLRELEIPEEKIVEKLSKAFNLKQSEAREFLH